ncbi:MAG: hypothetical protein ACI8R4_000873 [Paracoccaceae bacterium]|jgi:hypothetical protein
MRTALTCLVALLLALPVRAGNLPATNILSAEYGQPTGRYAHGILGDALEWGSLILTIDTCPACAGIKRRTVTITLPDSHVFEDLRPRLADLDGDGDTEVIVIETDVTRGAALAIYDETGKIAETPHIGRTHRWLAPLGAADLEGDGTIELAYIDRPHLAKVLRIWRFENGKLTPVADHAGLTNHQIGQDFISGGIRTCAGQPPEIITANKNWTRMIASTLTGTQIKTRDIGPHIGPTSFKTALACR